MLPSLLTPVSLPCCCQITNLCSILFFEPSSPCDGRNLPSMPKFRSFLIDTPGGNQRLPPIVNWIKPALPPIAHHLGKAGGIFLLGQ